MMLPPLGSAEHATVHRLANRTRCRCPCCGGGPRMAPSASEEDADYALRLLGGLSSLGRAASGLGRIGRAASGLGRVARVGRAAAGPGRVGRLASAAARTRRGIAAAGRVRPVARQPAPAAPAPGPGRARTTPQSRNPSMPAGMRRQVARTLRSMGWSGWQRPGGRRVTMQDLRDFHARGGMEPARVGGRPGLRLSSRGRELLNTAPFRKLRPLFRTRGDGSQAIYEIAPQGQPDQPHYVGKTARPAGVRLIEHLITDTGPAGQALRDLERQNQLGTADVATGQFDMPDAGRRSHLGEVLLQELLNPTWNDPRKHGFEDEGADL
jgi:hypothetical protein